MTETGNTNVYTIYRGRYKVPATDNLDHYCMLTNVNDVVFMGNYTADSLGEICTLPADLAPESSIHFPCYDEDGNLAHIVVSSFGIVTCDKPGKMVYLRGLSFNISCNYYAGE
jgi:hypothetical protein